MKIKTLITISLSILLSLVLTLGIIPISTTAVLADQIAQTKTEVVTPATDLKNVKTSKREAKKEAKRLKESEPIPPIVATPAQCNCDCRLGPLSGSKSGNKCNCVMGCP